MMRHLGPSLITFAMYVLVRHYYHQRLDKKLYMEAALFAVVTYFVMQIYLQTMGYIEGMTTFGSTCPNGWKMVDDPLNADQQTCRPTSGKTYPATTGFREQKKLN
jgi:hypothetical protein